MRKLRLTGGEPPLRRNLERLIAKLAATGGIQDIALTTNGALLARKAGTLAEADCAESPSAWTPSTTQSSLRSTTVGQHIATRRTRARASVPVGPVLPDHDGSPSSCWRGDDQTGQEVVLRTLTLTRQIWLICTRRDAKARARKTANTRQGAKCQVATLAGCSLSATANLYAESWRLPSLPSPGCSGRRVDVYTLGAMIIAVEAVARRCTG